MNHTQKKVIRCASDVHKKHQGNILCAFEGNTIYIKCNDRDCKRWTKLTLNVPGIEIDLSDAGIVQESLPENYHLHLISAITVVGQ